MERMELTADLAKSILFDETKYSLLPLNSGTIVITHLEGRMSSLAFLFPFPSVKYQILKSGNLLDVYHQVIKKVASKYQVRFVEAPGDHKVSILFCPVISRIGSDAETAIATIKGK